MVADCSRLIQFDTSNFGGGEARGERAAAEWVAEQLTDCGYRPELFESEPGRASTVVRIPGRSSTAPALLVHGHLDVVPAAEADWSFDPFAGQVRDGAVWGRGALDMKDMDAMMLSVARGFAADGFVPPRDLVLAFVADEEDTGQYGAGFLVERHPELFEGVRAAVGESGGYATHLPDGSRLYPIAAAERGSAWLRLTAHGVAGHGSRRNPNNPVSHLARALSRLADHEFPVRLSPAVAALISGLERQLGIRIDPADPASIGQLGEAARLVQSTVANSVNPTMLAAGYKANVIPGQASAVVDGRIVPGATEEFLAEVDRLLGEHVSREFVSFSEPVGTEHDSAEFRTMSAAISRHDPAALVLPFCMSGGTDAKAFAQLGIACYGFAPGRTPAGLEHWNYVHGVDEHVLIDSLRFGVRVLDSYLRTDPASGIIDSDNRENQ
ncbi:MAG: M20/M25/M40 family metallo-hydrolase [Jatrophihabitantaceae bacterium]